MKGLSRIVSMQGVALVLLFAMGAILSPTDRAGGNIFLGAGNQSDVLRQIASVGILAIGMTLVVFTGGIDLSVGSTLALGSIVSARLLMEWMPGGWGGVTVVLLAATACGACVGVVNGMLVAVGGLQPFIATLGSMVAVLGVSRLAAGAGQMVRPIYFGPGQAPEEFRRLASRLADLVPVPGLFFVAAIVVGMFLIHALPLGRHVFAVGGNEEAARHSGIAVGRVKIFVYSMCGALAGLTGALYAAQYTQGKPDAGDGKELDAIAAVVIGGTSLRGGDGSIGGTVVGVLLFGYMQNIFQLQGLDSNIQYVIKGLLIVVAAVAQGDRLGAWWSRIRARRTG